MSTTTTTLTPTVPLAIETTGRFGVKWLASVEVVPGVTLSGSTRGWDAPRSGTRRASFSRIGCYVDGEGTLANLVNRMSRPTVAWAKVIRDEIYPVLGLEGKIRWNQYAYCSCPCSPAFVFDGYVSLNEDGTLEVTRTTDRFWKPKPSNQVDFQVSINYDAIGGQPEPDDLAIARAESVLADPTLLPALTPAPADEFDLALAVL